MSQIEIAQVLEQIKEEIEVDALGNAKASIRATARLAGVSDMAIIKALESANLEPSKLALMLIGHRFSAANLQEWRTSGIPDIAIGIILDYYAHEAGRYCTKQAKLVCRAFSSAGVRAWIQDIKGWSNPTYQGYRFIHKLLKDHFARMDLKASGTTVDANTVDAQETGS